MSSRRQLWAGIIIGIILIMGMIMEAFQDERAARWGRICLAAGIAAAVALVLLVGAYRAAQAHDHDRPELNEWMKGLYSGKGVCCSGSDATVLTDQDWESRAGHYRVKIDNEWVDVPDEAVITTPNHDGRTLVWPIRGYLGVTVRCFMPGSMT